MLLLASNFHSAVPAVAGVLAASGVQESLQMSLLLQVPVFIMSRTSLLLQVSQMLLSSLVSVISPLLIAYCLSRALYLF
jgi:hypothetical protein